MILGFLGLAWLLGIAAAAFADADPWATVAAAGGLAAAAFAYRPKASTLLLVLLGTALIFAAGWRYQSSLPPDEPTGIARYNDGDAVRFRALVTSEPDERGATIRHRLAAREVFVADQGWQPSEGGILMRSRPFPQYEYGDLLEVEGKLETPPVFPDFNYRDYLARQGVVSLIAFPETRLLAEDQGNPVRAAVIDLRQRLSEALADALPEPHASLSAGILLGRRAALPEHLVEDMNSTGTSHLVAVSGQNVALVAALLMAALAWAIGRRPAAWLALAAIIAYSLLVGGQPSVQRAAVMGSLYVVATALGRQNSAPLALAVAGAAMTGFNPLLAKDVSFQLSFAATLGLMTLAPALRARGEEMAQRWPALADFPLAHSAIELMAVTLAAIAFTLPITAINFQRVSLVAPLANLLAVPAFVAVIVTAGFTAVLGAIVQPLGHFLGWLTWLPTAYMIEVVRFFADLPFVSLELKGVGVGHAIGYYIALGALLWLLAARRPSLPPVRRWLAPGRPAWDPLRPLPIAGLAMVLALGSAFLWLVLTAPGSGRLSATFLDVGQGDAILIRSPHGHKILVDGGPSGEAITAALGRHLPFWDEHLDLVILTHPQDDHLTGLIEVVERYDVERVLASPLEGDSPAYAAWREAIARRDIPNQEATAGQHIALGDAARLAVLHPPPELLTGTDSDINNNSLVLRLEMGDVAILLTGDLQEEGEIALVDNGSNVQASVLQVPHHGSRMSGSRQLLMAADPLLAVISVGEDNPFSHPSPEVLARLAGRPIFRTDRHGDITVSTDGHKLWIETQRDSD